MLNHGREALVTALRAEFPDLPVALVAIDNHEFGRIQARQLRGLVKPGAKVLCVRGNPESPLQAVVAQDDVMAMAARRVLDRAVHEGRADLKAIPVLGGDGLPGQGRRWVDEGKLTATVSVTLPGKTAVELVWRHWKDSAPPPAVTRLAPTPYPPR